MRDFVRESVPEGTDESLAAVIRQGHRTLAEELLDHSVLRPDVADRPRSHSLIPGVDFLELLPIGAHVPTKCEFLRTE